jgi:hypothetical protein
MWRVDIRAWNFQRFSLNAAAVTKSAVWLCPLYPSDKTSETTLVCINRYLYKGVDKQTKITMMKHRIQGLF